ncbi:hypothetical protein BO99DRAFT_348449, partial [Aspergillus violaceofuscus CBS 115571]
EVRGRFYSPSNITITTVNNLPFLNTCINKALRVYPAAPTQLPRIVPGEGVTVCNCWMPGGTKVYIALYTTFCSAENFYQPDAFLL